MTVRTLYDNLLIELNKVEAPSLLLEDFIYFANKAVQQYTNKRYNLYDITQQTTDDLRALKESTILEVKHNENFSEKAFNEDKHWFVNLPDNYMHLLNCVVRFSLKSDFTSPSKCDKESTKSGYTSMARRLTSDMYPAIISNYYFKPSYKCPYYFITNHAYEDSDLNLNEKLEAIMYSCGIGEGTGSVVKNEMEIRCGSTNKYYPTYVQIDYVRTPTPISLTYEDLESEADYTQNLEFPEYVCYEIQNELVKLVLENIEDPRLQTNIPINQTIMETSINDQK